MSNRLISWGLVASLVLVGTTSSLAQNLKEVPRSATLVTSGWDLYNQVPSPTNFNPFLPTGHQRNVLHYTISEPLFLTNYESGSVVPWLAESYRYADNDKAIVIKVRDGVTWADGERFDATDVAFTITMLKGAPADLMYASVMREWIDRVEIVDALTVRLVLTKAGPRFVGEMLAKGESQRFVVVPEHIWRDVDPSKFAFFDIGKGWPVGTGPYTVAKSDSTSMVFDRRNEWWAVKAGLVGKMPAPERIVRTSVTLEALPNFYSTNVVDVGRAISVGAFEAARAQNPALRSWSEVGPTHGAPDGCVYTITFNNQRDVIGNVLVRRAIGHAIERNKAAEIAYEGSMPTAMLPGSSFPGVAPLVKEASEKASRLGLSQFDPDKVTKLMTDAGFKKANGKWSRASGEQVELKLLYFSGFPLGPVVTQQLRNAGFVIKEEVLQQQVFNDRRAIGDFDLAVSSLCGASTDPFGALQYLHSKYAVAPGKATIDVRAFSRYANPDMDAALDRLEAVAPNPQDPKYRALVGEAYDVLLRDLPLIVVAEEVQVVVYNESYWKGWPSRKDPYTVPFLAWDGFMQAVLRLTPTGRK